MRITNSMMGDMFLSDANNSLSRVTKYQNQVDSTKRISKISDDPQATLVALKARDKLTDISLYQSNIQTVKNYLTEAESAANGMDDLLQNVYEEVVSSVNGSKNDNNMSIIADEIDSLKNEVVSIGNTNVGSTYIFGGYNFTGTTDGINVKQPFSIDKATGHLIYNNIDMSKISWAEDYEENAELMSSYTGDISSNTSALDSTSSDDYARDTLCQKALTGIKNLVESGKEALNAAKNFGIDESSAEYQNLNKIINGTGNKGDSDYMPGLEDLASDLYDECSKVLARDSKDGTNTFSIADAKSILTKACELIYNTDPSAGCDKTLNESISSLQTSIDSVLVADGSKSALADESDNRAQLQIGINHPTSYTFTGMDFMGSGTENIYYVLDKCATLLRKGDTNGLKKIIPEIQSAQDRVLGFEAGIGTTENRMDLLSSRYDTSKLNYTEMKSNAVDVDMAEAMTNLTTAKTVYNATLTGGAAILQTSLIDFLR